MARASQKPVFTIRYQGGKRSECAPDLGKAIKVAQAWVQAAERVAGDTVEVWGPGEVTVDYFGPVAADSPGGWVELKPGLVCLFDAGVRDWLDVLCDDPALIPWGKLATRQVAELSERFDAMMAQAA